MKVFTLQMTSTPSVEQNLMFVEKELQRLTSEVEGSIVVLPECFACFGAEGKANVVVAEYLWAGASNSRDVSPVQYQLSEFAKRFNIYLVAGTFPIKVKDQLKGILEKVKPMTLVYAPDGSLISQYQKIHLFDVDVNDNTGSYRESDTWQAGSGVGFFDTSWGRIGLAICYDIRFPSLFQSLVELGCKAIVLPSAFTEKTGEAHWEILLRARAIENQIYMIACGQSGTHPDSRKTYGHSMVVDPWGEVLYCADQKVGLMGTEMHMSKLESVRASMPIQQHNQFSVNLKSRKVD